MKKTIIFSIIILIISAFIYQRPIEMKYYMDSISSNITTINKEEKNIEDLITAINTNINLTPLEKENLLLLQTEIIENQKYISFTSIKEIFNTVTIDYKETNKLVGGEYNRYQNNITIYNQTSESIYHENAHLLTNYNNYSTTEHLLIELTNQLYTNEYNSKQGNGYSNLMPIIYTLSEIIDIESIKEFRYNPKISIIIDELLKIDNDLSNATTLINNINKLYILYQQENFNPSDNQKLIDDIILGLNNYYKIIHNQNINEDILLAAYYHNTIFETKTTNNLLSDYTFNLEILNIKIKGYISSTYKSDYPNTRIILNDKDNKELITLEIAELSRYKNSNTL